MSFGGQSPSWRRTRPASTAVRRSPSSTTRDDTSTRLLKPHLWRPWSRQDRQLHAKADEHLTPEEWKEFRSISGSLQRLASHTRPELGPVVSLSNPGKDTNLQGPETALRDSGLYMKATSRTGLTYQDVPLNRASALATFADSSWANADLAWCSHVLK